MHPPKSRRTTATLPQLLPLLLLLFSLGCARKSFYVETPLTDPAVFRQLQQGLRSDDSVTVQAGSHYARGPLYRLLWGTRHRNSWTTPVHVPVLDPGVAMGGLEVERLGGGMQTISAAMVGGDGMTYALRTVDKRPEVALPYLLRRTFLADLVLDQTSALHPYAALVVAPLTKAAGIPHPSPRLVYVRPGETALGVHQELLGDKLCLLEEKYNDKRALAGDVARADDIIGTNKMLKRRYSQGGAAIDQLAFAKARLLDLLIGDRDRHEGQWEWAVYEVAEEQVFRPIPKDRDNAFFRFDDGILSWLISRRWAQPKFVTFHEDYRDVKGLMIKAAYLDARALPEVTREQFDSLAHALQHTITDEVIEQAVRQLPGNVYALDGDRLACQLKSRRDLLDRAAREYYEILAKKVLVIGTDEEEFFEVVRLSDEETEVTVRRGVDGKETYRRVFYRSETDKIELQGLGGNDNFELRGQARKGIKVTLIGGEGQDNIQAPSSAGWWRKQASLREIEMRNVPAATQAPLNKALNLIRGEATAQSAQLRDRKALPR